MDVHFLSKTSFKSEAGCVEFLRYSSKLIPDSYENAANDVSNLYFYRYSSIAKLISSFCFEVSELVYLNLGFSNISVIRVGV